jgi:hypothetical protein
MAEKKSDTPPATETDQTALSGRYRILSAGMSGAKGVAAYAGEIVTAEQLGDTERITKLLSKKAIEAVADD